MTPAAARLGDPIAHNVFAPALKRAGFGLGLTVEILLIVGTGGTKKIAQIGVKAGAKYFLKRASKELVEEAAEKSWLGLIGGVVSDLADVIDGAVIGHWLGGKIGSGLDWLFGTTGGSESGKISTAAKHTFINGKEAARMRDSIECAGSTSTVETVLSLLPGTNLLFGVARSANAIANVLSGSTETSAHVGMNIAQGSLSVTIENYPAARVGDATKCDALVKSGSPNVGIGGVRITDPQSLLRYEEGTGVGNVMWFLDIVDFFVSLGGSVMKIKDNWKVDGLSSLLKIFGEDTGSLTLPAVDRAQKIAGKLREGKKLSQLDDAPLKGVETTVGKIVKKGTTGEGTVYETPSGGEFLITSNGEVVIPGEKLSKPGVPNPDVTEADVRRVQKDLADQERAAANAQEERYREMREKNNQGDRSGRH